MFSGSIQPFADVVDCTQMATLVKAVEQVDLALEYLELRFQEFMDSPVLETEKMLVFDNVNGICPSLEETSQPGNTVEIVKSERITRWLLEKVEEHPTVFIVTIARHFS